MTQNPQDVKLYRRETAMEPTPKKLLDRIRDAIRLKHYSIRTEHWAAHTRLESGTRGSGVLILRS